MPDWIEKTKLGFVCLFCGGLVLQSTQGWVCQDIHCAKHGDLPAEQQMGFAGWVRLDSSAGTASSVSPSPSLSEEIREGDF